MTPRKELSEILKLDAYSELQIKSCKMEDDGDEQHDKKR